MEAMAEYLDEATSIYASVLDELQGIDTYEIDVLKVWRPVCTSSSIVPRYADSQ